MPITQDDFEKHLVSEYFQYGSINKVFSAHHYDLPISFAGYTRVLSKYKVVKSAGPNSNLSESLHILSKIADYKIPLEKIYHRYAPHTIQVSTNTLHRILHYTRLGLTRRQGTALIITNKNRPDYFLVGNDLTLSNTTLGQKGDLSLPMVHSKMGEHPRESIVRTLQQEVFTNLVIEKRFPFQVVPEHPKPVMYINIADVRVSVYHLVLNGGESFSSYKLTNFKFRNREEISRLKIRPGVEEIINKYLDLATSSKSNHIPAFNSELNYRLYALAKSPVKSK